jgi:hypothetical protein
VEFTTVENRSNEQTIDEFAPSEFNVREDSLGKANIGETLVPDSVQWAGWSELRWLIFEIPHRAPVTDDFEKLILTLQHLEATG